MRFTLIIKWVLFTICIISINSFALVKRLSPDEGLSQSYVSNLYIDTKGFLWLSTYNGLNRYDGYQVVRVEDDKGALNQALINTTHQDKNGKIWIATYKGLYRYDPVTDVYTHHSEAVNTETSKKKGVVFDLLQKDDSHLWVAQTNAISVINTETGNMKKRIQLPGSETNDVIALLYHKGYLFIATTDGAFFYHEHTDTLRSIQHRNTDKENQEYDLRNMIRTLSVVEGGKTLLLGGPQGLYKVDISNLDDFLSVPLKVWKYETLLSDRMVSKIFIKGPNILLGTNKGLFYFDMTTGKLTEDKQIANSNYNIFDKTIIDIIEDHHGGIWVATKKDGAFYLSNRQNLFKNIHSFNVSSGQFSDTFVMSLAQKGNTIWLGTNNGLTSYDLDTNEAKDFLSDYLANKWQQFSIFGVHLYKNKLWLRTTQGLFTFDPETKLISKPKSKGVDAKLLFDSTFFYSHFMPSGDIYFLNRDEGFFKYNIDNMQITRLEGPFQTLDPSRSFGFNAPLASYPSQPLFTQENVIYRYDEKNEQLIKIYDFASEVQNSASRLLTHSKDKNNVLWLSFMGKGLVAIDADTYKPAQITNLKVNRLNSAIYAMQTDQDGMIWMSSHTGIWKLNPDNNHFEQFTVAEGLLSNEFNEGAGITLSDGRFMYGSLRGVTLFDPNNRQGIKPNLKQVNITSVEVMSRNLAMSKLKDVKEIELEHDDIGLEVYFSGMTFLNQERVTFEYEIAGTKKTLTKDTHKVVFPKLSPGEYTLRVRAIDPLTGQTSPSAQLNIKVKYPIWRSPISIVLYAILFLCVLGIWLYRKYKVKQMLLLAHGETRHSEARLKLALESSGSGVWDWQVCSKLIYQPRLKLELGYEHEHSSFDDFLQLVHPHDKATFRVEWLEFVSTNKGVFNCTYRLKHKQGHWRWYKDSGKVMEWNEQIPERVTGTYTNLTRERMFEQRARLFGDAFEQTRDCVFILDKYFRILACNRALQRAFGIEAIPKSSTNLHLGLNKKTRMSYLKLMKSLSLGEYFSAEENLVLANGKQCHMLIKISAISDSSDELRNYVVVLTDITSQKQTEKQLYQLANYDELTQLPNKALFYDRVQHAIEQSHNRSFTVVLNIHFNRLCNYKESYGFEFYQSLIRYLVAELNKIFKRQDTIAVGNDHDFLVLIEHVKNISEITGYAHALLRSFEKPIELFEYSLNLRVKIGAAQYPDGEKNAFSLVQGAKIALEHTLIDHGSYLQFFNQEMNEQVERAFEVEKALMKAHHERDFCNYYQPIINGINKNLEGFEVLLRWPQYPQFQVNEFTKIAEQSGIITQLMLLSFQRALTHLSQWHKNHPHLYISINLSAIDFEYADFITQVEDSLKQKHMHGHHVVFEIKESLIMANSTHVIDRMEQLKALGCRLYMDDFGTGYTTLQNIKHYPIDVIKINKHHVKNIETHKEYEIIIHSTLSLAHSLGLQCVAEGVENSGQLQCLRMLGCDYFQGYFFSKPLAQEKVETLLDKNWQDLFEVHASK